MKPIDELLRNLRRPEVLEFALASERLPCVKVGASFQPVDGGAPSTDQVLEMLVAAGGSRYVDALNEAPTRWSFRLDGVGVIGISAVLRAGIVQARFTLTKREAPTRHDSATITALAPPPTAATPSPVADDRAERHPSDDDEPTMVSEAGNAAINAASAPQVIVNTAKPAPPPPPAGKPPRKETPRALAAAARAEAVKAAAAVGKEPPTKETVKTSAVASPAQTAASMAARGFGSAAPNVRPAAGVPANAASNMSALTGAAKASPAPANASSLANPMGAKPGAAPAASPQAPAPKPVAPPPPAAIGKPHEDDEDEPATRANEQKAPEAKPAPKASPPPPAAAPVAAARPPKDDEPESSIEHARIFNPSGSANTGAAAAKPAQSPAPAPVAPAASPAQAPAHGMAHGLAASANVQTAHGQAAQRPARPAALRDLLATARSMAASDIHIIAGRPALLRLAGELLPHGSPIDVGEVEKMARAITPPRLMPILDSDGSTDFAFDEDGVGRFRANVSRQRTGYKLSLRLIPPGVPTLAALGLPETIGQATHHHQGLIVITGPTGHGKTSTLAALVDLINTNTTHHVITVEDPVEYVHPRKRAMMSQREVGTHTKTFAAALKASLRQDPDVIVVGELRDTETVRMALSASETGHLVLGTMNTPSAAKTIDRLIDLFPPADQAQVRATLAGGLRLIVSQRLIPSADRRSMVAVAELLPASTALYTLIRDNKTFQIPSLQQRGRGAGMLRLDDSLADLVRAGKTSLEIARANAESPEELDAQLKQNPPPANVQAATAAAAAARPAGGAAPPPAGGASPGAPAPPAPPLGAAPAVDKKAPQGSLFQRAGSLFNKKDG